MNISTSSEIRYVITTPDSEQEVKRDNFDEIILKLSEIYPPEKILVSAFLQENTTE